MITRIRHRGLRLYHERGERRLLPQAHIKRIDLILTRLRHSSSPSDMDVHACGCIRCAVISKDFGRSAYPPTCGSSFGSRDLTLWM